MPTVDCSQPLADGMPVYPGDDPVRVTREKRLDADGSRTRRLDVNTHVGTHVDAPAHKAEGPTLDAFDVSAFRFDARVVDVAPEPRERLTRGVLPADVRDSPPTDGNPMLLFDTGWSEHWGTDRYRDSPYLGPDLARWCGEHGLHVGLDAFSPDPVPSAADREAADEPDGFPAHDALCGAGRLVVENLRGLGRLPDRVTLHAYPLAIADGDGSPVRAVATW
jgi:kynurenine formamidase